MINSEEAEKRLSKKNPALYKMLAADNLVGKNSATDEDFEEDDKEIAYWEKKLGLNKKKKKKLGKEFEDDGLLDVLGNADNANNEMDDIEYLKQKRTKQAQLKEQKGLEENAERAVDQLFEDFPSDEDDDDMDASVDEDMSDIFDEQESGEEEEVSDALEDEQESDEEQDDDDDDEEEEEEEEEEGDEESEKEEQVLVKEPPKSSVLTKYVPPHLRKPVSTGKSEQQLRLQKQLQGQLNRLSELNIESILVEIEKCYGTYPRHGMFIYELYIKQLSNLT